MLVIYNVKGSVQQKLRPMLLYIIQKLFSRRWTAKYLIFFLLKGHFTIYIKPLQRACPSPVTFACKIIILLQIVSADSNRQNLVYLRPTVKQFTAQSFLSLNRSIWVSKNAEFYADSKSKEKSEKKCTI